MEKYSVVLLKESKIKKPLINGEKIFEESIVLCNLPENFFEDNSYPNILKFFIEKIPPVQYQNAYGEMISHEIVAVIDSFCILDYVEFEEFTEVYSRHFVESPSTTFTDIIEKFYSDFSLTKQEARRNFG